MLTHTERKSGMLFADKLKTPTAQETHDVTVSRFKKIPADKKHTINLRQRHHIFLPRYDGRKSENGYLLRLSVSLMGARL
jgi:hypothetical protein